MRPPPLSYQCPPLGAEQARNFEALEGARRTLRMKQPRRRNGTHVPPARARLLQFVTLVLRGGNQGREGLQHGSRRKAPPPAPLPCLCSEKIGRAPVRSMSIWFYFPLLLLDILPPPGPGLPLRPTPSQRPSYSHPLPLPSSFPVRELERKEEERTGEERARGGLSSVLCKSPDSQRGVEYPHRAWLWPLGRG